MIFGGGIVVDFVVVCGCWIDLVWLVCNYGEYIVCYFIELDYVFIYFELDEIGVVVVGKI